jgi:large subunit ribosomal protein L10e
MARVPGKMYRAIRQHAYTRREYMGGVPGNRILQFRSGNKTTAFPVTLHMVAEERGQVRHTALEALRITAVRFLDKKAGRDNYHLHVRVYPHHVLRQNKQASGAGADRVSMGMRLAFGKPIGTAARVEKGQVLMTIHTVPAAISIAKEAIRKATNKVATPCHINIVSNDGRSIAELLAEAARTKKFVPSGGGGEEEAAAEAAGAEGAEGAAGDEGEAKPEGEGKADGKGEGRPDAKHPKGEKGDDKRGDRHAKGRA